MIFDAASLLVDVWVREQRHNESSPYRFKELGNEGLGPTVQYTGVGGEEGSQAQGVDSGACVGAGARPLGRCGPAAMAG